MQRRLPPVVSDFKTTGTTVKTTAKLQRPALERHFQNWAKIGFLLKIQFFINFFKKKTASERHLKSQTFVFLCLKFFLQFFSTGTTGIELKLHFLQLHIR